MILRRGQLMNKVICPGSYDPITLGHIDVIKRCAKIFDYVYVAIGKNPEKKGLLTPEKRAEFARDAFRNYSNVEVVIYEGLTVDLAHKLGCNCVVKGIRNLEDLEYENKMAYANSEIASNKYGENFNTLYIPSKPEKMYISSSYVRQLIALDLDICEYVHNKELLHKLLKK